MKIHPKNNNKNKVILRTAILRNSHSKMFNLKIYIGKWGWFTSITMPRFWWPTTRVSMGENWWLHVSIGTVNGVTQPPPKEGAWSTLFSNLSKPGLHNYEVKCYKRPLLEEVALFRLPCPIHVPTKNLKLSNIIFLILDQVQDPSVPMYSVFQEFPKVMKALIFAKAKMKLVNMKKLYKSMSLMTNIILNQKTQELLGLQIQVKKWLLL